MAMMLMLIPALVLGCNKDESAKKTDSSSTNGTVSSEKGNAQDELKKIGFITYDEPTEVPAFEVPGIAGPKFSTDQLKGKITILNFWAPWCPPCKSEMPHLQEFYKEFKDKEGFQLIAVAVRDSKDAVLNFITENNYSFPVYVDENISSVGLFVSQGIPVTYIVNKDGKVVGNYTGAYDFTSAEFKAVIEGMLK